MAGMAADGSLAATVLTGAPGFISSPEPGGLRVGAIPSHCDPFSALMAARLPAGLLGIDFATLRRNRVNGRIASIRAGAFVLDVEQSFGNRPKYIRRREISPAPEAAKAADEIERFTGLDEEARALVVSADTFFVASSSGPDAIQHGGVDISIAAARPGFIAVDGDRLRIPDYPQRYFNTFGNFLRHPLAALLFIDFASGDLLHLTGRVDVNWESKWSILELSAPGPHMSRPAGDGAVACRIAGVRWIRRFLNCNVLVGEFVRAVRSRAGYD